MIELARTFKAPAFGVNRCAVAGGFHDRQFCRSGVDSALVAATTRHPVLGISTKGGVKVLALNRRKRPEKAN
ncbi:hypothetical protein ACTJJ7_09630 [Phyllobacterium sp. 22229]|uniref:Uncharacterized protein n=1 Tax=Phyllobacterium myrsinacearum TaxID=28101 RepID=A0A2S9JIV3_9HYPH|nr:hypothetical protein [Phyllobacterium myrsinacearum]PRD53018.1 hypothetical protein C5750_11435 [Phyllobacterium myrsinacearum]